MTIIITKHQITEDGTINPESFGDPTRAEFVDGRLIFKEDVRFDSEAAIKLEKLENCTFENFSNLGNCSSLKSISEVVFNGELRMLQCTALTKVENTSFSKTVDLSTCLALIEVNNSRFYENANFNSLQALNSLAHSTFHGIADFSLTENLTSLAHATFKGETILINTDITSMAGASFEGPVDLTDSDKLIASDENRHILQTIEDSGKEVKWPSNLRRHDSIEDAKEQIYSIIDKYTIDINRNQIDGTQHPGAPNTKDLYNRYLSENLGARDGAEAVANSIQPFIKYLQANPSRLDWLEEVSKGYLTACVNQPVAGFAYISALCNVAGKKTVQEKMEAAKQLIALEIINQIVAEKSPGSGVEVEAGNALMRIVHGKLLEGKNIERWPGIPGSLSYEGTIKTWIDGVDTDNITATVLTAISVKPEVILEHLMNKIPECPYITFPEETAAIRTHNKQLKNNLKQLIMDYDDYEYDDIPEKFKKMSYEGNTITVSEDKMDDHLNEL